MADYRFFLSYARTDAVGPYLDTFFQDLANEVRRLAALSVNTPPREVGFLDTYAEELGATWRLELMEGLQSSRVFLALYSRAYFASETSGKEFHVFRLRAQAAGAQAFDPEEHVILPILWDPVPRLPKKLPDAVEGLQYNHGDFPQTYAAEGLLTLLKQQQKYQDDYRDFVDKLAFRIVEAGTAHALPPAQVPPLEDVPNAFQAGIQPAGALEVTQQLYGPRYAHFFFMAGTADEMQSIRNVLEAYAQGGRDWRPFLPDTLDPIGVLAQTVASNAKLHFDALPVSEDFRERIRAAESKNTIVILIIDPWVVYLDEYKQRLCEYDEGSYINSGVLITWNHNDPETAQHAQALQAELSKALRRTRLNARPLILDGIRNPVELRRELRKAISRVRQRIAQSTEVIRPATGPGLASIPEINGPTGQVV